MEKLIHEDTCTKIDMMAEMCVYVYTRAAMLITCVQKTNLYDVWIAVTRYGYADVDE